MFLKACHPLLAQFFSTLLGVNLTTYSAGLTSLAVTVCFAKKGQSVRLSPCSDETVLHSYRSCQHKIRVCTYMRRTGEIAQGRCCCVVLCTTCFKRTGFSDDVCFSSIVTNQLMGQDLISAMGGGECVGEAALRQTLELDRSSSPVGQPPASTTSAGPGPGSGGDRRPPPQVRTQWHRNAQQLCVAQLTTLIVKETLRNLRRRYVE